MPSFLRRRATRRLGATNAFHESINEQQIKEADAMVSTGLRDAGYIYLNLDDKRMDDDGRDGSGNLVGDSERFPSGMKALADYVPELTP